MMMLETGRVYTTLRGRKTQPHPRIDVSTDARCRNSIKRSHGWLLAEALAEVEMFGEGHQPAMFKAMGRELSKADLDSCVLYLFGEDAL